MKLVPAFALLLLLVAAVPAEAQTLHFGLGIGSNRDAPSDDSEPQYRGGKLCILTDRGLRNAIADMGYKDIALNVATGFYVEARATRDAWVYRLKLNACTGEIVERTRLRKAR